MLKNYKKGFTLIELLVVIAIIGILSSVVLASLNSARTKGKDAAIKAQLSNMRADAEIIYDSANSYATVCTAGQSPKKLYDAAVAQGTADACNAAAAAWSASVRLNTTAVKYFCVDSTGTAAEKTTALGAGTVCPAA